MVADDGTAGTSNASRGATKRRSRFVITNARRLERARVVAAGALEVFTVVNDL